MRELFFKKIKLLEKNQKNGAKLAIHLRISDICTKKTRNPSGYHKCGTTKEAERPHDETLSRMGATLQTENMTLIALFFCKLSKDSPAPPIVHAVTFDKAVQGTTTKRNYLNAVKAMQAQFKAYKYFNRLAIVQDLSDAIIPDAAQWPGEFQGEEI